MTTIVCGLSAEESPLPLPELALGNIVRLKKPYRAEKRNFLYGIIVEHVGWNAFGHPQVSLHLYDEHGQLHLIKDSPIPCYVDFNAPEFLLLALAKEDHVVADGFDLYPTCPVCRNKNQHPFAADACQACGGWGHQKDMRRWQG